MLHQLLIFLTCAIHKNNVQFSTVARIMANFNQRASVENQFKKPHIPNKFNEDAQLNIYLNVVENGLNCNFMKTTSYKRQREILLKN